MMIPNPVVLRKLRFAAAMLSAAVVLVTWSGFHKRSPVKVMDVTINSMFLLLSLLVIWRHIWHSPFHQLYWGWAFILAGGFSVLFFTTMAILSLYLGDDARIVLGGIQSASAFCCLLGGWLLVFDKDINAWRDELKDRGLKMSP